MKKLGLICLVVILTMGAVGMTYASWSQDLSIRSTATTGTWIYRVQSSSNSSASGTAISATWPKPTTSGNLLIAIVSYSASGKINTTPSGWQLAGSESSSNGNAASTDIYYYESAPSQSATGNWTFNPAQNITLIVVEYLGIVSSSAFDRFGKAASTTGGGNKNPSTGTTTSLTSQNYELALGSMVNNVASNNFTLVSGGFSKIIPDITAGTITSVGLELILTSQSNPGENGSIATTARWAGAVATFKGQ